MSCFVKADFAPHGCFRKDDFMVKTVSGHLGTVYNLKHNNRDIITSNVDSSRCKDNYYCVASGHTVNGVRYATTEEIYDRLFEQDFQEYQKSLPPSRRCNGTYLEYIREHKAKAQSKSCDKRLRNNAVNEAYEVVFQIGDKNDTGFDSYPDDFEKAGELLDDFCDYLVSLPYTVVITEKELNNPNWKPPDSGIAILNLVTHHDEACAGIHADIVCFTKCDRGAKTQALSRRTFESLGYPTGYANKKDGSGKKIVKKGILDWVDDMKDRIAEMMKERYNWDRGEVLDGRNHLDIQEYKKYAIGKEIKELENQSIDAQMNNAELQFSLINDMVNQQSAFSSAFGDKSKLWEAYRTVSGEFWGWYKEHKSNYNKEFQHIKENKNEAAELKLRADYYRDIFFKSANLIAFIAFVVLRLFQYYEKEKYQKKLRKLLQSQKELKKIAKSTSTEFAKLRNELKSTDVAADRFIAELQAFQTELENDYYKMPEYEKIEH